MQPTLFITNTLFRIKEIAAHCLAQFACLPIIYHITHRRTTFSSAQTMISLQETSSFVFLTTVILYDVARHQQGSKSTLNNEAIGLWEWFVLFFYPLKVHTKEKAFRLKQKPSNENTFQLLTGNSDPSVGGRVFLLVASLLPALKP